MDLQALLETFAATLSPDAGLRSNAETTLRGLESNPEFSSGCLDILVASDVPAGVKSAAGLYLKNTVAKAWRVARPSNDAEFRQKLLAGLRDSAPMHRQIFLVVLYRVIDTDYPDHWPDLVPTLHSMLSSDDVATVWAGLSGVLKVCLRYRWSSLTDLDAVLASIFPLCLSVAEAAVASDTAVAGSMLYDFCKIYKYTTQRNLPAILQGPLIGRTVQVFVRTLQKQVQYEVEGAEREYTPWAKAKKWASFNLLRTHVAYVSALSSLSSKRAQLTQFRAAYNENLTPHILEATLKLLVQWSQHSLWLPQPALCNLLTYLEGAPQNKKMWEVVEPYIDGLLQHVIYPLLSPTEDDLVLFDTEPVEYVHKGANSLMERTVPDQAAENLLLQLVQRRKNTFAQAIQFIQQHKESQGVPPAQRAGILRMLDALAKVITMKNNPVKTSMESFIIDFVLPDVLGGVPIVRSYALHLVGTYATLDYSRPALQKLYEAVHTSLYDQHLPIQVEAARALQGLAENEDVKAAISEHIPRILQHLLDLTKRIDLDSILVVMDDFINMHPDQVTPFAVELVSQLRDQFLSTASELDEAANVMPENYDLDDDDALSEKKITAASILRTIENLQYSLENHTDILVRLESVIIPIFQAVYEHELIDFYVETLALHENTICCIKQISEPMWAILPGCITAIEAGALECIDDANPVFENYILFGADALAADPSRADVLMKLILNILSPENETKLTASDWTISLQLAKKMLGTSRLREGPMDRYLETLLTYVAQKIAKGEERIKSHPPYGVVLVGVVHAAIYNNAPGTLEIMSRLQMVPAVTQLWFQQVQEFKSVEALKFQELSILAVLLNMRPEWSEVLPQLMKILALTVEALPGAISRLEEQRKAFEDDEYELDDEYETDNWDNIDDDFAEDKDSIAFDNKNDSGFVASESFAVSKHDFISYDFSDDRDANPFVQSPLDNIDAFFALKQGLEQVNATQPEVYAAAMGKLEESDKALLQDGILRAPA